MPDLQLSEEAEGRKLKASEVAKAAAAKSEARQKSLEDERASLDAKIQEAIAPAASEQNSQAVILASLTAEVENLRYAAAKYLLGCQAVCIETSVL